MGALGKNHRFLPNELSRWIVGVAPLGSITKEEIMIILAPSILSADFSRLGKDVKDVEKGGAKYLHIDVMDGQFVPNISFGAPIVKSIRHLSDMVFDVHLMIKDPFKYIDDFYNAGADIITFHVNSDSNAKDTIDKIKSHGIKCGLAINPDIPLSTVLPYKDEIDMLLIMSVYAGFGGQTYIDDVNEKIKSAREIFGPDFDIEVDGGIGLNNKKVPVSCGANILVSGSAIFDSGNAKKTTKEFLKGW